MNWPALAMLGAVAASYVGIFFLARRRFNFSLLTLSALGVGIVIGLAGRGHSEWIEPIGRIYINLLLASVAPLVVVSIIASITSLGSLEKLKTVGLRSFGWLMVTNVIAVILTLGVAISLGIGKGVNETLGGQELNVLENSVQSFTDVVVNFFPVNVVGDLGSNHIIPIIVISIALAIAYLAVARKDPKGVRPFRTGIEALRLVIYKAVGYVIKLTPYAVLALTATVVADSVNLTNKFWSLIGLLVVAWVVCFADLYIVNGLLLRTVANVSPVAFFRKIFPAQVTAFTTQSSVGTLPVTTSVLTTRVGVHPEVAHFTAPLGTTIGMPGVLGHLARPHRRVGHQRVQHPLHRAGLPGARAARDSGLDRRGRRAGNRDGRGRNGPGSSRIAARVHRGHPADLDDCGYGPHGHQRHRGRNERHDRRPPSRPAE
ncbi:MAG: dicarboxylate/amino acid:cation symporter [Demequina sp.]|nr:dicarboxylate/amino acid:cation symporter [Demequina sp.]